MLNEEVYIEIHWANNPIPIDEIVDSSNLIFEIPFGVFTPYPVSPVNSVNGKIGDIQLTAADINADESGTAQNLFEALDEQKLNKIDYVQHFRGLYDSFADLIAAIPIGTDGDYAQTKNRKTLGDSKPFGVAQLLVGVLLEQMLLQPRTPLLKEIIIFTLKPSVYFKHR